jgi:glyoxylase-like metal-dependent hydrolase (beta-lactamase superfamily II)
MQTIRHHAMARLCKYVLRKYASEALRAFASAAAGVICFMLAMSALPASAQQPTSAEPVLKQITSDLYFFFEFDGSNAVFLVTDEGVLLIDTRTHPRHGKDLLDRIRKVTDKPIKWVINSHFHGDHHMGNVVFKDLGATFIAHKDTAHIMQHVHHKEMARRIDNFKSRGLDPNEVKLVLPDVTFAGEATIRLGGRDIRLIDLGPGQQAGDTYVHFPHARVLFTPGAFGKKSMPNMAFTPSVETWVKQLGQIADMDIDRILPAHGDVATRADVKELAAMLADEYATVKQAVEKRVPVEEAVKTLTFPQYKDWRNYRRLEGEIRALYELIGTGKRSYLD